MRKRFSLLSALAAAAMFLCPCAADEDTTVLPGKTSEEPALDTKTSGDFTYVELTNAEDSSIKAACIEDYKGTDVNLIIPETIDGLDVVMLGDQCICANRMVSRIELPKTLQALGEFTFAECTGLKEYAVAEDNPYFEAEDGILYTEDKTCLLRYPAGRETESYTIPDTVTTLGNVAFAYNKMKSVTLPDSLTTLGKMSFSDCTGLTEITVPAQVATIPEYCFYRCKNLKKADLNNNITTIDFAAFACTAIESIDLPTGLVKIGQCAFVDTPMKSVTISSKVTDIGYSAFGFRLAADQSLVCGDGFVIRGIAGSAAEKYTKEAENAGAATFEALNQPQTEAPAATTPNPAEPVEKGLSAFRTVGIIVCCCLLVLIAVIAIVSGKKRGKQAQKDETPAEPIVPAEPEDGSAEEDSE